MGSDAGVIVLHDGLTEDGLYLVHLMSNQPIERELPPDASIRTEQECGTYVLKAAWPYRGPCEIVCAEYDWRRVVVLWALHPDDRISQQAVEAARVYFDTFGRWPECTWLANWPQDLDPETMIKLPYEDEDEVNTWMAVCESDFVPRGCLAVGSGGTQPA